MDETLDGEVTARVFDGKPPAKEWPWKPSTNLRQAMMVAEELMDRGLNFRLYRNVELAGDRSWDAHFDRLNREGSRRPELYEADASTPEAAICLAAIQVVKGENKLKNMKLPKTR